MDDLYAKKNSDECSICGEGGNLICCDSCPESYHLNCLGLSAQDVEGIEKWSCQTCHRKRKLLLSPPKSPRKRQKQSSLDDSKKSAAQSTLTTEPRSESIADN